MSDFSLILVLQNKQDKKSALTWQRYKKSPHKSLDLWGSIVCNNKGGMRLRQCGGGTFCSCQRTKSAKFSISEVILDVLLGVIADKLDS